MQTFIYASVYRRGRRPFVLRSVCRDQSDAELEVVAVSVQNGRKKRVRRTDAQGGNKKFEGKGIKFRTTLGAAEAQYCLLKISEMWSLNNSVAEIRARAEKSKI